MSVLAIALQYYTHLRLNNDPGWTNIKVSSLYYDLNCYGCIMCVSVKCWLLILQFMCISEGYSL